MATPSRRRIRPAVAPLATLSTILTLTALFPHAALACASCGCTLSSDWDNLGISSSSGTEDGHPLRLPEPGSTA